jgi:hypothetical protein
MNPIVQALIDVSRFAAALAQLWGLPRTQRAAILAAASDNGWSMLVGCMPKGEERPSSADLDRLAHE